MSIHVSDILDFLVGRSAAPSTMGAQLDRLRFGLHSTPDPFRARDEVEANLLHQAVLLRCIDDFSNRHEFTVTARGNKATGSGYKILDKIQRSTRRGQGEIAICILRAYHEWATQSQERGLLEIYNYLSSIAPEAVPTPPKNEPDLLQAFRTNAAKRARALACEAYADSLLALQNHVRIWNKQERGT